MQLLGAVLDRVELDPDFLQPDDEPLLQPVRCGVAAATSGDESLDVLLEAELAQARRALVEMLAHLASAGVVDLTVEVEVDLLDHLGTRDVVGVAAAHRSASRSAVSCSGLMKPRSRAYCSSALRSARRPRCSLDITVPIGVPMMSAISL